MTDEDLISSAASSRHGSISSADIVQSSVDFDGTQRRRSSTGDVSRFRQKMRKSLLHENHDTTVTEDLKDVENRNTNNSTELHAATSEVSIESKEADNEMAKGSVASDSSQLQGTRSCDNSLIVNVAYEL